jgi:hypothetical protein
MSFKTKVIFPAIAACFMANSAQATVIFSTGTSLSVSGIDQAWSVTQTGGSLSDNSGLTNPPNAYAAPYTPSFPFTSWGPPIAGSQWIVPTPGGPTVSLDPKVAGLYTYSQTFLGAAGMSLSGQFMADNAVTSVTLTALGGPTFTFYSGAGIGLFPTPTSFGFGSADFASTDLYTLSFVVDNFAQNGGNPSSLDVAVSAGGVGGAPGTPEPSTWAMIILGFLGIGLVSYRRRGSFNFRIV